MSVVATKPLKQKTLGFLSPEGIAALDQILDERKRMEKAYGEQNQDPFAWQCLLGGEFGDTAKAILEHRFSLGRVEDIEKEAIQMAAVALAFVECLERGTWKYPQD